MPNRSSLDEQSFAVCTVCGHKTPFDPAFLNAILGRNRPDEPDLDSYDD